jgi:hypothetical protein
MKIPARCRYCKSPARGNPCWFALDYPLSGGDPPCVDDDYREEYERADGPAKEARSAHAWSMFLRRRDPRERRSGPALFAEIAVGCEGL